jgi:AraC family transcriptional activator of tynA and feaB
MMQPANSDALQRWSTADVPPANRLEYFANALSKAAIPVAVDSADPLTFGADISFASLGSIWVCKASGSPLRSSRGASELARSDRHSLNLIMSLKSPWTAEHRGLFNLAPGDMLVHDSQYAVEADVRNPFDAVTVGFSDDWLRQWVPNPGTMIARRIPGATPWGRALSTYLAELSPEFVLAPPLPFSVLADQVGSLIALAASGLWRATQTYTPAVRSLHERIQECLVQRCTEPQLTAPDLAASVNISVRTLHRIFAAANETFGGKLIEARARVAVRMLTSRLFNRVTTAEIGRRAGFLSPSHFARVIRQRTGRTPLQLRRAVKSDAMAREFLPQPQRYPVD